MSQILTLICVIQFISTLWGQSSPPLQPQQNLNSGNLQIQQNSNPSVNQGRIESNPGIAPSSGQNPGIAPSSGQNPGIAPSSGQNPGIAPSSGQNLPPESSINPPNLAPNGPNPDPNKPNKPQKPVGGEVKPNYIFHETFDNDTWRERWHTYIGRDYHSFGWNNGALMTSQPGVYWMWTDFPESLSLRANTISIYQFKIILPPKRFIPCSAQDKSIQFHLDSHLFHCRVKRNPSGWGAKIITHFSINVCYDSLYFKLSDPMTKKDICPYTSVHYDFSRRNATNMDLEKPQTLIISQIIEKSGLYSIRINGVGVALKNFTFPITDKDPQKDLIYKYFDWAVCSLSLKFDSQIPNNYLSNFYFDDFILTTKSDYAISHINY